MTQMMVRGLKKICIRPFYKFEIGLKLIKMISDLTFNKKTEVNLKKYLVFLLSFSLINLISCNIPQKSEFLKAQKAAINGEHRSAAILFENIILRDKANEYSLKSARELVKLYLFEIKDYEKAIEKLKFIVHYSKDSEERIKVQKQIALIYFDNLANYEKAISEYSKLLSMSLSDEENIEVRVSIARGYYHLGNFEQSWREASSLINLKNIPDEKVYDLLLLQANIKMALKDHTAASKIYEQMMAKYPTRSIKENIPLSLSLCYEVQEDFMKAISVLTPLKKTYQPSEFIEYKISKLMERQQNKPKKRLKK